jgi:thiopurine S-methyltransferase
MQAEFWIERWQAGQIGFHLAHTNPWLERCWQQLEVAADARVFVPLCGKSLDLLWLRAQGHEVVGVEVSRQAVQDFFAENDLQAQVDRVEGFERWQCDGITLLVGDYFALRAEMLGEVAAVYDRASLIALPQELRRRYVQKKQELFATPLPTLLITLEYEQRQMQGPPFSVDYSEVQALYAGRYSISQVISEERLDAEPHFRSKGLTSLLESVYLLQPL